MTSNEEVRTVGCAVMSALEEEAAQYLPPKLLPPAAADVTGYRNMSRNRPSTAVVNLSVARVVLAAVFTNEALAEGVVHDARRF